MVDARLDEADLGQWELRLRDNFDRLLAANAREVAWLQCEQVERLLVRASQEPEGVAQYLLEKVGRQLVELDARVSSVKDVDAPLSQPVIAQSLMTLISEVQPEAPNYSENSRGAAFDEFLQQQENNILQAMVGDSNEADTVALAPALTRANRYLRHRQLHSSATRLVDVAIEHGPENPGPLNPEMLSIKSLKLMRDLSPQYLNRFVAFIDSLLWIEESVASSAGPKTQSKTKVKSKSKKTSQRK